MDKTQKILQMIKLMILEEYRMNAAMIGKTQFIFFPIIITFFALVLSISAPALLTSMSLHQIYLIFHLIILIYGLGIGGFALFGDSIAERRFGQLSLLLETPILQPINFNTIFLVFYIKDVIYYLLFSLIPIIAGIAISIPITGFSPFSVLFLLLSITLTFLFGISFSFFLSSIYVRWKTVFSVILVTFVLFILGGFITGFYAIESYLPSIRFQFSRSVVDFAVTFISIIVFSAIAVKFIKVEFGRRSEKYSAEVMMYKEKFGFTKIYSTYIAKEWLDMKRSRTLYPIVGAYIGPLIFLSVIFWFFSTVLSVPLDFNIIFYSAMIGFFGMTIYSWLNVLDNPAFYQVLPVDVPHLIRTKLVLFFLLSIAISTGFIVILSIINQELHLLWLALVVAFTTTAYTVIATAYLTGLRTNSYLFSPKILGKFMGVVALPLIALTILSFMIDDNYLLAIALICGICATLIVALYAMFKGIDKKWGSETFVF